MFRLTNNLIGSIQRLSIIQPISRRLILSVKNRCPPKPNERLQDVRDNIYTIPNALCIARIASTPVIGYLVLQENYSVACGVFILAGITDLLDGQIARRFPSQRSLLGTMLDPVADKLLISTLFVTLSVVDLIPCLLTIVVFTRDFLLLCGAFIHRYRTLAPPRTLGRYFNPSVSSIEIKPTFASKLNTVLQLATVAFSLAAPVLEFTNHEALQVLWVTTAVTTVYSGLQYIGGGAIKKAKKL